ncbi:MAG: hypothetical protein V4864_13085 [Pseudomonadota bacterium]
MELRFGERVPGWTLRAAARRLWRGWFGGGSSAVNNERPVWQPWPL